jgi:hypothetical protein
VPRPGLSFIGIHKKRTIILTRNVVCPNVQFICSAIPWAKTVQGATPRPAATIIASPVPKIHKPIIKIMSVLILGLSDIASGELQLVDGTFFAGLRKLFQSIVLP